MHKKSLLIGGLIFYILSASATFAFFTFTKGNRLLSQKSTQVKTEAAKKADQSETTQLGSLLKVDPSEPKDQACPLNGALYTKTEKDAWSKRRPLAVMIENSPSARPQSGLTKADVVYEALAEGGVTRFMALFYCAAQRDEVTLAPIRSARTYFVDWASGYNRPIYVHVGGANIPGPANALGQLRQYGWNLQNDFNQFSIGYPTFVRNKDRLGHHVATEHTMETSTEKLWRVAAKRGWTNMSPQLKIGRKLIAASEWRSGYHGWSFMPVGQETPVGDITDIKYDFWSGYNQFTAEWRYDTKSKVYLRSTGGEIHRDLNNNEQLFAKNVVILKTKVKGPIDELKHLLYRTEGVGDALVFTNGKVYPVKWKKLKREAELNFYDRQGKPFKFNRGLTWISVLSNTNKVIY